MAGWKALPVKNTEHTASNGLSMQFHQDFFSFLIDLPPIAAYALNQGTLTDGKALYG
jgi:hypothetical protein